MKPQMSTSPTRNAGARNSRSRASTTAVHAVGRVDQVGHGIRNTSTVSAASTAATCEGFVHQPSTGETRWSLTMSGASGSAPSTSTPDGSSPVSSTASRSAAVVASSPGSNRPPGNAIWPGWVPSVAARRSSSTSSPPGASCAVVTRRCVEHAEQHEHGGAARGLGDGQHGAAAADRPRDAATLERDEVVAGCGGGDGHGAGYGFGWAVVGAVASTGLGVGGKTLTRQRFDSAMTGRSMSR